MCDPKQDSFHNYSNLHLLQFHLDEISLLFDPLIALWCGALHNEETKARHSLIIVQKVFFSWQWKALCQAVTNLGLNFTFTSTTVSFNKKINKIYILHSRNLPSGRNTVLVPPSEFLILPLCASVHLQKVIRQISSSTKVKYSKLIDPWKKYLFYMKVS